MTPDQPMESVSSPQTPPVVAGRPTLRMVADLAGVSTATVSYVLSGRARGSARVSEATVGRVREAAQQLQYRPNQAARTMRTGRTNVVLLSLTMLSDPWSQAMAEAVSAAVTPAGLTALILADGDWRATLDRQKADAVFVDGIEPSDVTEIRRLAERGDRIVVFDDTLEPDGFDVVRSPAIGGCRLAIRHLLEQHRRIGCLAVESSRPRSPRLQVYYDELAAVGIAVGEHDVETFERDPASAYEAATRMLERDDRPTAIYAVSDFAAISAIRAAHRLGLRVPDDVAVIGVGNTIEGERTRPALSTVGPTDFYPRVAEIIRDRAIGADAGPGRLYEFDWSLFARESTAV